MSKNENQDFFNELAQKPAFVQMRTKALITHAQEEVSRNQTIRDIVVGDDRSTTIESQMEISDNLFLVIKSSKFVDATNYSFDFVDLSTKSPIRKNNEYYASKEEAVMAAMITRMGGSGSIIHAATLMIKGHNSTK